MMNVHLLNHTLAGVGIYLYSRWLASYAPLVIMANDSIKKNGTLINTVAWHSEVVEANFRRKELKESNVCVGLQKSPYNLYLCLTASRNHRWNSIQTCWRSEYLAKQLDT